jgi:catechol-2,3-dioxygenase
MVRTEGLTHIHLLVSDLNQSLSFSRQVFGMEETFREGLHLVSLRTPGSRETITLNAEPDQDHVTPGDSGGIAHFGFRLKEGMDLGQAIEEVIASGGRLVKRGEHGTPGRCLGEGAGNTADPSRVRCSPGSAAWRETTFVHSLGGRPRPG